MTITPFETTLYEQLTPFFEKHHYTLLPDKKQYRRTTDTGFQNVFFYPAFYGDETLLDVSLGCRNDQVEQIAQQFLMNPPLLRPDANTIVVSIGKFLGFQFVRFSIHSAEELIAICIQIEEFFKQSGFRFLAESSALPTLDQLLNEQPNQPCPYVYNQMHRCYKGLITARLTHNAHFDGLIDVYRHLLVNQTQNPHEQRHFERLIAYLHHYSAN
jgi:hypothetical protein